MNRKKYLFSFLCIIFFSFSVLLMACNDKGSQEDIEPHTHTYGQWQIQTEPSCLSEGTEIRKCTDCNESFQRSISALGHDYQNGYCTRCGEVDPNDNSLHDGTVITNVAVSKNGVLSWDRLKIASKYKLTLTLSDGEHTYDLDKNTGSVNLKALSDGAQLGYGKNSANLKVYKNEEEKIDGETVSGDVEVSTDSFLIRSTYSGLSLTRLTFEDDYVKLAGFYSEYYEKSNGDNYLLNEVVMTGDSAKFNISNLINEKNGQWKIYKSSSDRDNLQDAMEYLDFLFDEIDTGSNNYYLRVVDDLDNVHDYNLVVRGVEYVTLSLNGVTRTTNNDGDYIPTYTNYSSVDILQYDSFDINSLYNMIPQGHIIRDNNFNIYEKDIDYMISYSNLALYSAPESEILAQIEEINSYKDIFNLSYNSSSSGGPDSWSIYYNHDSDVKDVFVPARIIGNRVLLFSASFINSDVESVIFESGIKSLPVELFKDCTRLNSVTIPDTVTYLGDRMFKGVPQTLTIFCEGNPANGSWNQVIGQIATYYNTLKNQTGASSTVTSNGYRIKVSNDGNAEVVGYITDSSAAIPDTVKLSFDEYIVTGIASGALANKTSVIFGANIATFADDAFGVTLKEISVPESNASFSVKDNVLYNKEQTQIILVPQGITGKIEFSNKLTSITVEAFKNINGITEVTISDSITSIGNSAFNGCTGLVSVTIGSKVTTIGDSAFYGCTKLTSINISDSVTSLGNNAFSNCAALIRITIADSVNLIGNSAFSGCTGLADVVIGSEVISIGNSAFNNCTALTSIIIPDNVTSLGNSAFNGCNILSEVTIGSGVTSIGNSTFNNCIALTGITIPSSVISLGDSAFNGCSALIGITIEDGLKTIGVSTFSGCTALTSIKIPNSVTLMKISAFTDCIGLLKVDIDDIAAWCKISFESSNANPLYYAKNLHLSGNLITELIIPENVTKIDKYAFVNCVSLTSVVIPSSVKSIGQSAFNGCSGLIQMNLPFIGSGTSHTASETTLFGYIFGTSSYTDGGYTKQYYSTKSKDYKIYYIPANLKTVVIRGGRLLYGAFYNCINLNSITLSENISSIEGGVFNNCSSLTNITIPQSVVSIGSDAFNNCSSLTNITIPQSVVSIGSDAFNNCTGGIIQQESDVSYVGKWVIDCETTVNSAVLRNDSVGIANYAFSNCTKLAAVLIPDSVLYIGQFAFNNCTGLTSIAIPDSVTSINYNAFNNCTGLTSIAIPDSVSLLADAVFNGCSKLKDVDLGNCLTSINSYMFNGCVALNNIIIPDTVTKIDSYAFYNCSGLTSISISDNVTEIGDGAFYGCTSLISIVFPDSIKTMGNSALGGCSGLTEITLPFTGYSKYFTIASENTLFGYIFGISSFVGGTEVTQYYSSSYYKTFYLPSNLKTVYITGNNILDYTFYNCSMLTSITIPANSTSIGSNAFYNCTGLNSITIPDSITSIGYNAFYNCTGGIIQKETGVSYVDKWVVACDQNVTSAVLSNNIVGIANFSFYNCTLLTGINISDSVLYIGAYAFENCSALTDVIIGNGVLLIYHNAFENCTALESILIPESVIEIRSEAFSGCSNLTSATFVDANGWYVSNSTSGTNVVLTDPIQNASYLTGTYSNQYWEKA